MKTIDTVESLNGARFVETPGWLLSVAAVVIVLLSLAMAVNAKDLPASSQGQGTAVAESVAGVQARSESEIRWNEREDFKAGGCVGLPGIY